MGESRARLAERGLDSPGLQVLGDCVADHSTVVHGAVIGAGREVHDPPVPIALNPRIAPRFFPPFGRAEHFVPVGVGPYGEGATAPPGLEVSGVRGQDGCLLYTSDAADELTRVDLGVG